MLRASHALANLQPRSTVSGETFSTSAVSYHTQRTQEAQFRSATRLLRQQTEPAQQVLRTRVGANTVEPGVGFEREDVGRTLLVRPCKPPKCLIRFAKTHQDDRHVHRGNIPF